MRRRFIISDRYLWWRQALLGEFGAIYESDPQPGYYRMRKGKGGPWVPVAIWVEEGQEDLGTLDPVEVSSESPFAVNSLFFTANEDRSPGRNGASGTVSRLSCLVSGVDRDPYEIWTWCCRYPVTYEAYVAVAERGEAWPEDLPVELHSELERLDRIRSVSIVDQSLHTSSAPSLNAAFGLGHNSAGVTEAEAFLEEIEIVSKSAEEWITGLGSISSQVEADKAANYTERFSNLEARAEEARTIEKRPVLDLGKEIDAKWKPVIAKASDGKVRMKKAIEPYLIAERDRRIAKNHSYAEIEPPRAGTSGRRIGLRSKQVISVLDQDALNTHYHSDQRIWSDKSVKDLILKLAETDLLAGLSIPGASLIEELTAA